MCNRCRHRALLSNVMEGLCEGLNDMTKVLAENPDDPEVSGESNGRKWTVEERKLTFAGVRAAAQLLRNFWDDTEAEDDVKLMMSLAPEERSEVLDFFGLLYHTTISVSNAMIKTKALMKDADRPEALAGAVASMEGGPLAGLRVALKEILMRNAAEEAKPMNPLGTPIEQAPDDTTKWN